MTKIFILTEGGGNIGLGHITRCLSLYQALVEYGHSPTLIIRSDESDLNILSGIECLFFDWISNYEEVLSIINSSDILIIDSYMCPLSLYQKFSLVCSVTAYIDDDIRVDYPKGVIINGVMCAEKMNYQKKGGMSYLLGCEYSFLRKEFWDVPDKVINKQISSIMITCGGNDENGLSFRILKTFVDHFPKLNIKVILKKLETPYLEYYRNHSKVYTNLNALDMREVMIDSDIAITASGQTSYELCRIGTPFIAITTAENQNFSINCFQINGLVGNPINSNDEKIGEKILDQFNNLADYQSRKNIYDKMKKTINGKGSLKVIEYLLSKLGEKNDKRRN